MEIPFDARCAVAGRSFGKVNLELTGILNDLFVKITNFCCGPTDFGDRAGASRWPSPSAVITLAW
jgi:hypothetical protein